MKLIAAADTGGDSGAAATTAVPSSGATEVTTAKDDDGTDPLAIAALVVAIVAGLLGAGALVTARRKPWPEPLAYPPIPQWSRGTATARS